MGLEKCVYINPILSVACPCSINILTFNTKFE